MQGQLGFSFIGFVRPGEKAGKDEGFLGMANVWQVGVNLRGQLKFLEEIAVTNLHQEIML